MTSIAFTPFKYAIESFAVTMPVLCGNEISWQFVADNMVSYYLVLTKFSCQLYTGCCLHQNTYNFLLFCL